MGMAWMLPSMVWTNVSGSWNRRIQCSACCGVKARVFAAVGIVPERQAEGPLSPAPWRRAGWAPAASGAGGVRQGAVPFGIGSQQDVQHGCFRGRSGCSFCCSLSGFVVCRRRGRQTCRVGVGDGSRSVPVRPLVAVDGGRDDGGETAFLVDCQRAHHG